MYIMKDLGSGHVLEFATKEELVRCIVQMEKDVWKIDPETYVPSVFADVAMNGNDIRLAINYSSILPTRPGNLLWHGFISHRARSTIVCDGDGRVVDIRPWLPEFRTAMAERKSYQAPAYFSSYMGPKQKYRKCYRRPQGFKQSLVISAGPDHDTQEEILEYASAVPVNMTRVIVDKYEDRGTRNYKTRSWKEQSKCRKSWQRRSGQPSARQIHKQSWLDDTAAMEQENCTDEMQSIA